MPRSHPARQRLNVHVRRGRYCSRVAELDHTAARRISLVVIRVDLDAMQRASRGQLHDRPVVPLPAPATRLPAITHVCRSARHDEVVPVAEEHVAAEQRLAAVLGRGEVYLGARMVTSRIEDG